MLEAHKPYLVCQEGFRIGVQLKAPGEVIVLHQEHLRSGMVPGAKRDDLAPGIVEGGEKDGHMRVVLVDSGETLKSWNLKYAARAPRAPDVEHHRFPSEVGLPVWISVQIDEVKIRGFKATSLEHSRRKQMIVRMGI